MIILGLIFITFIYILFPILYKAHKGNPTFPKALLLSIINSAICTVIYFFVAKYGAEALNNDIDYANRYLPVFIFFFIVYSLINLAILKKRKRIIRIKKQTIIYRITKHLMKKKMLTTKKIYNFD